MWGRETLAMLVSSNSMKVAIVTVMAMSQGLIAGLAVLSAATSGLVRTCVATFLLPVNAVGDDLFIRFANVCPAARDPRLLRSPYPRLYIERLRRKHSWIKRCVHCTQRRKIKRGLIPAAGSRRQ